MNDRDSHYLASGSSQSWVTSSGRTLASEVSESYVTNSSGDGLAEKLAQIGALLQRKDFHGAETLLLRWMGDSESPAAVAHLLPPVGNAIVHAMLREGLAKDAETICSRILEGIENYEATHRPHVHRGWPLYTRAVARIYALRVQDALNDLAGAVAEDTLQAQLGEIKDYRAEPAYLVQCFLQPLVSYDLWPKNPDDGRGLVSSLETVYGTFFQSRPAPLPLETLVRRIRDPAVRDVLTQHAVSIRKLLSSDNPLGVFVSARAITEGVLVDLVQARISELRSRLGSSSDRRLLQALVEDSAGMGLEDAIVIAKEGELLPPHALTLARMMQRFGNYIHPYKHAKYLDQFPLDSTRATMIETALRMILSEILPA